MILVQTNSSNPLTRVRLVLLKQAIEDNDPGRCDVEAKLPRNLEGVRLAGFK